MDVAEQASANEATFVTNIVPGSLPAGVVVMFAATCRALVEEVLELRQLAADAHNAVPESEATIELLARLKTVVDRP